MTDQPPPQAPGVPGTPAPAKQGKGCLFYGCLVFLILFLVIAATAGITYWYVKRQLDAKPFTPTELTFEEKEVLDDKMETLGVNAVEAQGGGQPHLVTVDKAEVAAVPEAPPAGTQPPIRISEKELNGLVASVDPALAERLKISLDRELITASLNFPVPEDSEVWAGRNIRGKVSLRIALMGDELDIRINNVTVAGFSVPGAWMKDIKDKNLALELFGNEDTLKTFVAGIAKLEIANGEIIVIPNE